MHRKCCVLFLLLAALCPVVFAKTQHSSSSSSKPVHVDGYYRKDGTYVAPHDRSLPGYGTQDALRTGPHVPSAPDPSDSAEPRRCASPPALHDWLHGRGACTAFHR